MKMKDYLTISVAIFLVALAVGLRHYFSHYHHHKDANELKHLEDFPILKQPDGISCGPTSATMILRYLGHDVEIEEVKKKSKTTWYSSGDTKIGMTAPDVLARAIRSYKVPAMLKTGNLDEIKCRIDENRPVIVLLRSGQTTWHYVVVIKYTEENITVADPAGYTHSMDEQVFLDAWKFTKDMDGKDVTEACPVCGGDGEVGWMKCEACNEGRIDLILMAFILTEIQSCTMIIVN